MYTNLPLLLHHETLPYSNIETTPGQGISYTLSTLIMFICQWALPTVPTGQQD